jgi:hypothetical protein
MGLIFQLAGLAIVGRSRHLRLAPWWAVAPPCPATRTHFPASTRPGTSSKTWREDRHGRSSWAGQSLYLGIELMRERLDCFRPTLEQMEMYMRIAISAIVLICGFVLSGQTQPGGPTVQDTQQGPPWCGWIGVQVSPMTPAFADSLGMAETYATAQAQTEATKG